MHAIKRNVGWLLVSQVATWTASVAILIAAPRTLGDRAYGQLMFAIAYVGFVELLALFGTGTFLTKTIARDPASLGRYVFNTLVMKALVTSLLVGFSIALAKALGYSQQMILVIAACSLGMFLNVLNNALVGGLQGIQRMARPAMWEVVRAYAAAALGLSVLLRGGNLVTYAFAINLVAIIPVTANLLSLYSELRPRRRIEVGLWREILVGGSPFFVLSGLLLIYGSIDIPILQAFSGSRTVGWYALAYRWVSMPAFLAASVATAFFPALSAERVETSESFTRMANRALRLVVSVATPAAVGIALIARSFLGRLYGPEFQHAVPLMQILALHIPIVAVDIVLGSVVIAADRQRQWVVVSVVASIFNPILNLGAIPLTQHVFGNGAIGAAIVTVLTELILLVGAVMLRPAGVLDAVTTRVLLRIVVASSAMIPVVIALDPAPLAVRILAGMVTYALASLALRTVSFEEIKETFASYVRRAPSATHVWPEPNPHDMVVLQLTPPKGDPMIVDPLSRVP
jgi:O-antigen/teichoic acid export membrane protein